MSLRFCPIASGSDGNSIYIGSQSSHILFDAGLSGKRIQAGLDGLSVEGGHINAIFISHEHSDHIQGAGVMSRRFDIPLYATPETWHTMERYNMIGKIAEHNKKVVSYGETVNIDHLSVVAFATSHDAVQSAGYNIFAGSLKISIATDLGVATDTVNEHIYDSDILLLESNHDVDMLKNGSYPWPLKKRILGERGHLSNVSCGQLLTQIYSTRIKHVFLGHLSQENNRPVVAMETVKSILYANKINPDKDFNLHLANRQVVSTCVECSL